MKDNPFHLEICADSVHAALTAQEAGAYRIELCRDLPIGGITPSGGEIQLARKRLNIKLNVLIRPRGGNFVYDDIEFDIIKSDVELCGKLGCDGVVVGILNKDGSVNKEQNRELIQIARSYSMTTTFHRAFDESNNLAQALTDIIDLGFDRILTSGGKPSAAEGADNLRRLIEQATGRIIIMPGAGVTPINAESIITTTRCRELHGSFQGSKQKIQQVLTTISHL